MGSTVIWAENLKKSYPGGTEALKGLSLEIKKGERIGIMGPSGAGKTTLLRLLNAVIFPTSGNLEVLGEKMNSLSSRQLREIRSKIAVVQQNHNVIPRMSVLKNVLMGYLGCRNLVSALRMLIHPNQTEVEKVYAILKDLEMEEKLYHRCEDLSGGQQQRVAIARALVNEPDLIMADEPIASVDSRTAGIILDQLLKLNETKQTTLLMNLHQPDFAINYCTRILVINQGKLIYDGEPEGSRKYLQQSYFRQGREGTSCDSTNVTAATKAWPELS